MARTRQRKRAKSTGWTDAGKLVHLLPGSRKGSGKRGILSKILRGLLILLLCVIVAGASFLAGGYFGLMRSVGDLEEPVNASTSPTYIYSEPIGDTDGSHRVLGTIFRGKNQQITSLEQMPPHLLDALVAKEDERFREHPGVDVWGIIRALYVDIRAGEAVEGASTITQQYVRNAYLSQDRTLSRKLKEAALAIEVERKLDKDEILANYLNTVYFGSNAYGVEAAAETYFNESIEDLSVSESATLVGLLWSPSTLGSDRDAAATQRNLVLDRMFDAGYVAEQDYMAALEEPLPEKWPMAPVLDEGLESSPLTKEFTRRVQEELVNELGAKAVIEGGLTVYTSLDLEDQVAARDVLYGPAGYLAYPDNPDAALVSIEPESGKISAMVGNRDENSQFDLVTQARRQPGSSFKPFALISALEQGIDPKTEFVSGEKVYEIDHGNEKPERWEVENFDGERNGSISLEQALWLSDNSVFTDLVMNAGERGLRNGPESVVDVAERLGVQADFGEKLHPSLVLGTEEVSPLDMATAYATIANKGRRVEPHTVVKVVRNEGKNGEEVLYKAPAQEGEQVISPEVAAKATEILVGDVEKGIAHKAALDDRTVAGKTGTSERFFDSWFIGYTPQLATAVWMGYAEGGATLEGLLNLGGEYVGPVEPPAVIWRDYTSRALSDEPVEEFEGVDTSRYDPPPPPPRPARQPGAGGSTVPQPAVVPGATVPQPTAVPGTAPVNPSAATPAPRRTWAQPRR
ncbi:PBP1A family penicillin-binding protein [soil metagenome]